MPSLAWVPDALAEGPVSWRLEPDGGFLFHEAALGFHTEHSERQAMPSWAAAEGAPPDLVDGLGGWRLKGGEVCVDTMTRRIEKAQIAVAAAARLKAPHEDCFDESIIAERLRRSLLVRSVGAAGHRAAAVTLGLHGAPARWPGAGVGQSGKVGGPRGADPLRG